MENHPQGISVTAPVSPAIEGTKHILFRPFDLNKWFAIGFCAWLAHFGQGGFNYNNPFSHRRSRTAADFGNARTYFHDNLTWIVPLIVGLVVVILVLVVLFLWLQSRGSFMLLHCVALNRGEVAVPWRKFAREAHSLWLFRLALSAIGLVLMLPIMGTVFWVFIEMGRNGHGFDPGKIPLLIAIGLAWFCFSLPLMVAVLFTREFVVPIMYLRGVTCMQGWRVLFSLLEANTGRFVFYILFQIVIRIALFFIVLAFVLCTCCIGGLFLIIPYVGAVICLPINVFARTYSLLYLAQYGEEFNVFRLPPEPGMDPILTT